MSKVIISMRTYCFLISTFYLLLIWSCQAQSPDTASQSEVTPLYDNHRITVGANDLETYLPLIADKTIGLVVNQTSMVDDVHLADTLLASGVEVTKIFAPEHGFRGTADAGATIEDGRDSRTGLPVISLYGKNKKPSAEMITDLDILIFDIQDVGARFYTYISTMHYVMEAAAENGKSVIVLDRPNPNGHYVAGTVLDPEYRSFVGMHPVPIVHGMTVGEYALMINGEGWLADGLTCELTVIPVEGYDHNSFYKLPVRPSPNLPNMTSIYLYPLLCLFEGTSVSIGRGTQKQFQLAGSPYLDSSGLEEVYRFTPTPQPGAQHPKHDQVECVGLDLSDTPIEELRSLRNAPQFYLSVYRLASDREDFFTPFFDKLAGSNALRNAIISEDQEAVHQVYNSGIEAFKTIRSKYLLYDDFE